MSHAEDIKEAVNEFQNAADRAATASSTLTNLVLNHQPGLTSETSIAREAATLLKHIAQTVRQRFEREEETR
jgi:hypothetical protein